MEGESGDPYSVDGLLQAFCARVGVDYLAVETSDLTPFYDAMAVAYARGREDAAEGRRQGVVEGLRLAAKILREDVAPSYRDCGYAKRDPGYTRGWIDATNNLASHMDAAAIREGRA